MSYLRLSASVFAISAVLLFSCKGTEEPPKEIFDNVALANQEEVTSFAEFGYEIIHGDLLILEDVQNVSALSTLEEVTGHLMIGFSKELVSLDGLDNLKKIGGHLNIQYNDVLNNISALSEIDSVHQDLIIKGNTVLADFGGFENLKFIGGDLDFEWNDFESLDGFESLKKINGGISIKNNHEMQNLTGFNNLDLIGGTLRISWNDELVDIRGLSRLTDIDFGSLIINYNGKLNNLCGLKNLSSDPFIISISDNLYNPTLHEIRQGDCKQ